MSAPDAGAVPMIDSEAWAILADLLEYANDTMSLATCNDYAIPNTPANRAMVRAMNEWGAADDAPEDKEPHISDDGKEIYVMDWALAGYFAHLARELAGLE